MPVRAKRETDLDWVKSLRFHVKRAVDDGDLDREMLYALDRAIDVLTANVHTQGAVGRIASDIHRIEKSRGQRGFPKIQSREELETAPTVRLGRQLGPRRDAVDDEDGDSSELGDES